MLTSDELQQIINGAPAGSTIKVPASMVPPNVWLNVHNNVRLMLGVAGIDEIVITTPTISSSCATGWHMGWCRRENPDMHCDCSCHLPTVKE